MDPQVSSSFIPKKTLDTATSRVGGHGTGLITLLAILIFVASVVAAGVVFAYHGYLKQSITSKSTSLTANQQAYDPGVIQELTRADTRINEAKKLLDKHIAPSAIFAFLSSQTLEKVQFLSFDYTSTQEGKVQLTLHGVTDTFSTVALQSDQLGASKSLKNVVFSGVNSDQNGKINFTVTADVIPTLISYESALALTPATPNTPTIPTTDDASSSPQQ